MNAPTDPVEPTRAVIEEAALWQARLGYEESDAAERARFDRWMNAHPSHRVAFDRMSRIAGRVAQQDAVSQTALDTMLTKRPRRGGLLAILLLGGAGLLGWSAMRSPFVRVHIADARTARGEVRSVRLATADRVTLDSDSAIDVDESRRSVRLWRGGVMAEVRHGDPREFVVRTSQGTARALGTAFTVRIDGDGTIVAVIKSRVKACADEGARRCLTLSPGQVARLDSAGAHQLADVDPVAEAAWSEGLLIAEDLPLAQVIDRLNRYRKTPIRFRAAELKGLSLSGAFPITDGDRALASISAALPVMVERESDRITVRRR